MKDVVLVVLGAIIGIAVKALVEPLLARRSRQEVRGEKWLEDAMFLGVGYSRACVGAAQPHCLVNCTEIDDDRTAIRRVLDGVIENV